MDARRRQRITRGAPTSRSLRSNNKQDLKNGSLVELKDKLRFTYKKFNLACSQLHLLNVRIQELQERYDRAAKLNQRTFRYSYRLQIATYEGVRNVFYEYAHNTADIIDVLREQINHMDTHEDDHLMTGRDHDVSPDEDELDAGNDASDDDEVDSDVSNGAAASAVLNCNTMGTSQMTFDSSASSSMLMTSSSSGQVSPGPLPSSSAGNSRVESRSMTSYDVLEVEPDDNIF